MDPPVTPNESTLSINGATAGELYDFLDKMKSSGNNKLSMSVSIGKRKFVDGEEGVMVDAILKRPCTDEEEAKVPVAKYSTCNDADEDLLDPKNDTGTPLFSRYPKLKELYNKHKGAFWDVGEVRGQMHKDRWDELSDEERQLVSFLLIFFLKVDSIIMENVGCNFQKEVTVFAAKQFYAYQNAAESIHSDTYALWVETYLKDEAVINALIARVEALPSMKKKKAFCEKYMDPKLPFAVRLVAFSVVEGIFFAGAFSGIFWNRKRGKLDGLAFGNGLIFGDESFHVQFADLMFSYIKNRPLPEEIADIVREGVNIEIEFMNDAIESPMVGMNHELMSQFIRYIGDMRMLALNEKPIYNGQNPFDFMELTAVKPIENFFEKGVTGYRKASSVDTTLDLEEAFRD